MSTDLLLQEPVRKSRKRRSSGDAELPNHSFGRTLKQYSVQEKLEIIGFAKLSGNRAAGRQFNVAESSIREWRKNEKKLLSNLNAVAGMSNVNTNNNDTKSVSDDMKQVEKFAQALMFSQFLLDLPMTQKAVESVGSVSTPSSTSSLSSASTPPPSLSPIPTNLTGSGRRKARQPQKVLQEP
ncbi:unnamed protein product [Caenorhabditis bovis]|uniref:Brinker DNA-binding domain-containing protein n=1 Tax=Caenorhabditis bovis TaxID=2654633 RepID=A0A8S1E476_9PELO|nr:unnamed protein product [Caenorhabditis bovis]